MWGLVLLAVIKIMPDMFEFLLQLCSNNVFRQYALNIDQCRTKELIKEADISS